MAVSGCWRPGWARGHYAPPRSLNRASDRKLLLEACGHFSSMIARLLPCGGWLWGAGPGTGCRCTLGVVRGYTQDKEAYLKRLRRIEGQVRGLQRMVDEDVYCIDVLTQVSAVTRALQAVALGLLEDHLGHCVTQALEQGGPEAQEKVREAAEAISRLVRS